MEDFSTFCKNQPSSLSRKFSLKVGTDRFWNLIFWFGMSAGFSITFAIVGTNPQTRDFPYLASVVLWLTIIGIPFLVRAFSKTTFVKDKIFLNSEGRELNRDKDLPNGLLTIATTIVLTSLTGVILDKISDPISNIFPSFIFFTVLFGVPSLFFILKNCPISILFNCNFWSFEVTTIKNNPASSDGFRTTVLPNPIYGSKPANTLHRHR